MKLVRPLPITDAVLVSSSVPETDAAAWSAATTYAAQAPVIVMTPNVHHVYESAQGGNTNHNPVGDDGTWWTDLGATNRWRMFDGALTVQSQEANSLAVELAPSARLDTVALLNVSASTGRVTMTVPGEGVVYDETRNLFSNSGITDWYAFFFEPVIRAEAVVFDDLPPYAGATIDIALSDPGAVVGLGECVLGLSRSIGDTQWSPEVGIQDFSVKTLDDFGNYNVVVRNFSKYGNFTLWVEADQVDAVTNLLASYRAIPILYLGDPDYTSTIIFGYYKDYHTVIAYPDVSILTLDLEGLT